MTNYEKMLMNLANEIKEKEERLEDLMDWDYDYVPSYGAAIDDAIAEYQSEKNWYD